MTSVSARFHRAKPGLKNPSAWSRPSKICWKPGIPDIPQQPPYFQPAEKGTSPRPSTVNFPLQPIKTSRNSEQYREKGKGNREQEGIRSSRATPCIAFPMPDNSTRVVRPACSPLRVGGRSVIKTACAERADSTQQIGEPYRGLRRDAPGDHVCRYQRRDRRSDRGSGSRRSWTSAAMRMTFAAGSGDGRGQGEYSRPRR